MSCFVFFLIVSFKDNKGEKIHDPSKADFSPWTQFCGYMHVVPSILVAASCQLLLAGGGNEDLMGCSPYPSVQCRHVTLILSLSDVWRKDFFVWGVPTQMKLHLTF